LHKRQKFASQKSVLLACFLYKSGGSILYTEYIAVSPSINIHFRLENRGVALAAYLTHVVTVAFTAGSVKILSMIDSIRKEYNVKD